MTASPSSPAGREAAAKLAASLVEHADRYSRLGWALIRCNGKKPRDSGWEQAKPLEPAYAAGMWAHYGARFNMGGVLGASGVAVLEYDNAAAEPQFIELLGGELPKTPICRTGSGFLHCHFVDPGGLEKKSRDALELRVGNHHCLLPPSVHPETGKPYEWLEGREPWTVPLAPLPAAVVAFFQAETGSRRNGSAPAADTIPRGERNERLASLAGTMRRRGMSAREIVAALRVANAERCRPPLGGRDVERIAESVARYEPQQQQPAEPFVLEVPTARELCALPDPDQDDQLLGQLLIRGQRLVLGGHTGEGKTTLAMQMVRAFAHQLPFLDWTGAGGRVLILDAEQGLRTVKRRLREAQLDDSELVDYVRVPEGLALDSDPAHVAEVERVIGEAGYGLVVADPLYKLHTGDSNNEREAVDLMRRFDGWRERYGFALLLPVHCRKPVPGMKFSIHDLFGSSAYVRGAEVVLGIQRVSDGYSKLHFLKDRDGDLPINASWGLLFNRDEGGFRRDPNDGRKETAKDKVVELLAEDPLLRVDQLVEMSGYAKRTVQLALRELKLTGDENEAT